MFYCCLCNRMLSYKLAQDLLSQSRGKTEGFPSFIVMESKSLKGLRSFSYLVKIGVPVPVAVSGTPKLICIQRNHFNIV